MPRAKDTNRKRVELWFTPSQIKFINAHFKQDTVSAKAWMEAQILRQIRIRKSQLQSLSR